MGFRKHTTLQLNGDARVTPIRVSSSQVSAKLSDFQFNPTPGFLYVTTRAISSRVNANYDGWPPDELRKAYRTFIGRPVYVDHNNWDLKRSRGVIIDAKLYETKLASGHEDVWVQLLIEVDADAFPKLAKSILGGDIDSVSMGADVEYTICSVCDNKAHDVLQYCAHIPQLKGREVDVVDKRIGKIRKLCFEDCFGVSFFEISFVFDPADESALISDVMLASRAANRSLAHVRQPKETLAAYSERLGTSMMKVASITMPEFCDTCGSTDLAISKTGAICKDCGVEKRADKALMSLPQEVDTLRDELNCPQCGSEWNGMVCLNCGFEMPPEGLGDPDTTPMGMQMPGQPGEGDQEEEGAGPPASVKDKGSDKKDDKSKKDDDKSKKDDKSKSDDDKSKKDDKKDDKSKSDDKKDDKSKSDDKSKDKDDKSKKDDSKSKSKDDKKAPAKSKEKKSGQKEDQRVSRFDDLRKQATLPVDPPYRQDTSPAESVPPYGQAIPGGNEPEGVEPALEPAPAAHAVLQELDAGEVVAPVGQSEVDVVGQPDGPTNAPPPGPQVGESVNRAASREEKRAAFYRARVQALRDRADEFEKKAETITQTDVRNLDEPPAVDVGPDATQDVLKATDEHEQLALADTPDVINDGSETGLPAVRDRLNQQVNPFNDAALAPYQPVNQQVASVESDDDDDDDDDDKKKKSSSAKCKDCDEAGCKCVAGKCVCKGKKKSSSVELTEEQEAAKVAAAKAHEDQRVAAAKTRVLRVANFVDERIEMGLTIQADKFRDIAKFEEMDDATLDGFVQATREFKAKEIRTASKRINVSASTQGSVRMPSLGSVSHPVEDDDDPADDYVAFL